MNVDKYIEEYKKISYIIFLNDDFAVKKKYIDKNNKLIKKICEQNNEEIFFEKLFQSQEPLILNDVAHDAFNCRYNIRKCLSIMEYLKTNADNLVFSDDPIKDEQLRKYCSNDAGIDIYRKEVEIYDLLNDDEVYRQYDRYIRLIGAQVNWVYHQSNKKYADMSNQIDDLLSELNKGGHLGCVFDIANNKYKDSIYTLNYLAINAYYACRYNCEKAKYRKVLADILKIDPKYLTQTLIDLINTYLGEIDKGASLNNG